MPTSDDIGAFGLVVHPHEHVAAVHGRELDLTCREYEIITRLVEHPGWVFSAEQLSTEAHEADYSPESVSVLVSRLRRKLAGAGAPDAIETVRGFGYRLRPHLHDAEADAAEEVAGDASLRDACWLVQEAVIDVEHSGDERQRRAAVEALEAAHRAIRDVLGG
jgi:DNA-binding winged helix-turn-helix (wHTH) protein